MRILTGMGINLCILLIHRFIRPGLTCFEQDTYLVTGRDADCDPAIR